MLSEVFPFFLWIVFPCPVSCFLCSTWYESSAEAVSGRFLQRAQTNHVPSASPCSVYDFPWKPLGLPKTLQTQTAFSKAAGHVLQLGRCSWVVSANWLSSGATSPFRGYCNPPLLVTALPTFLLFCFRKKKPQQKPGAVARRVLPDVGDGRFDGRRAGGAHAASA